MKSYKLIALFSVFIGFLVLKEYSPIVFHWEPKAVLVKPNMEKIWKNELVKRVKFFETFSHKPYLCPAGILTVGYGHTGKFASRTLTKQKAEEILAKELEEYRKIVCRNVKVPLTENQICALVSFTHNCGEKNLRSLINGSSRLNSGNYSSVSKLMPLYSKAKGKKLNGLVKRRKSEVSMWNGMI